MKKIAAISLLILILTTTVGSFLGFYFNRVILKNQFKTTYSKLKTTVKLSFSKAEIKKNKSIKFFDENEFKYNGEMYDIVSRQEIGDSLIFICFQDIKDRDLITSMNDNQKKSDENNYNFNVTFAKFFNIILSLYPLNEINYSLNNYHLIFSSLACCDFVISQYYEVPNPPPKFI